MTTGRGREIIWLALIIMCTPTYAKTTSVPSDTLQRIYVALDQACQQIPASPRVDEACKLQRAVKEIMDHPEEDTPPAATAGKPVENRSAAVPPTIGDDETYQQEMQQREMQQRKMRQREAQRQWQMRQAPPPPMPLDEIFCRFLGGCY
jgi:hypothetical protein